MGRATIRIFSILVLLSTLAYASETQQWDNAFLSLPSNDTLAENLFILTSAPNVAGRGSNETAQWVVQRFAEYGLSARIDTHDALLSYPKSRKLSVLSPTPYTATLREEYYPEVNTSGYVETFNGYSPSGNVTGELVYANYGTFEDFELLKNRSINVSGKIVIVRYGKVFRGLKPWLAQENGAIGCIIYSDPQDDGFTRGPVFPEGPWRPESGVQRGSVLFLSLCPGDPRNPLCRTFENQSYTDFIPKIPTQPISWGDAQHLLSQLQGPHIPEWQGGMNFTYNVGPGPAIVNLDLDMEFSVSPIWNVIGEIAPLNGNITEEKEVVIIGGHRDAWLFGAGDPSAGTATLVEVARCFSELLTQGWIPKRRIIFTSWDAEEYGLVGSTYFADKNPDIISKAVVYINVDGGARGPSFSASASHSLDTILREVSKIITDPNTNKTLNEVWDGTVSTLGSGSDYTAFLHHHGIPSIDFGFSSQSYAGVYHSLYDSYYWVKTFGDPEFRYMVTLAQFWGILTMRFSDSDILPFDHVENSKVMQQFYTQTEQLLNTSGGTVDFTKFKAAIQNFATAAAQFSAAISQNTSALNPTSISQINSIQFSTEKKFLGPGLPERPYYKHLIQAPGLYLGYGTMPFPGLQQALYDKDWALATKQTEDLTRGFDSAASVLFSYSSSPPTDYTSIIIIGSVAGSVVLILVIAVVILTRGKCGTSRSDEYERIT